MADYPAPVATQIQPPDPMRGINTFSGILGIKQRQQELQIGQAEVQKQQQLMSERQQLQAALQGDDLKDENGEIDPHKLSVFASTKLPLMGQQVTQNVLETQTKRVDLYRTALGLNNEQRSAQGKVIRSAMGSDMTSDQILAQMRAAGGDDPKAQANVDAVAPLLKHIDGMQGQQRDRALAHLSEPYMTSDELRQMQESRPAMVQQQGGVTPFETNQFAPGAAGAQLGPTMRNAPAPAEMPAFRAQVTAATSAAEQYAGGASKADVQRANEVRESATNAGRTIQLTKQIDDLFDAINSGKIAEAASHGLKYMGFASVAEARATLEKDLGQIKGPLAQRAGSDSRAADVLQGYPDSATPAGTAHAAMDQVRGMARQDQARYQQLQSRKTNAGFQDADTAYTSKSNPLMHEFMALKPEERAAFYKRNFTSAKEAQKFKDSVKSFNGG